MRSMLLVNFPTMLKTPGNQSTEQSCPRHAQAALSKQTSRRRTWLSSDTLEVLTRKGEARLAGQSEKHRRLKGVFKAKAKADLESHYNALADEAETGLQRNDLRPVYRAITQMRGGCERVQGTTVPISKNDGTPCVSVDEVLDRWNEHYQQMLNYAPASLCPELDDAAANAAPAGDIREDAPTLEEVQKAIRKLRNGRAAGPDEITPERLKTAEIPISIALQQLFLLIWKSGKVPADWKEAVIISLYKGKGSRTVCSNHRPISLLSVPGKVFPHVLLHACSPSSPVYGDHCKPVSRAVARQLTPYWHCVSWLNCIVNSENAASGLHRHQGCLRFSGMPSSVESASRHRNSTIPDPADPGPAHRHNVTSPSRAEAVKSIFYFLWRAARVHS